MSLRLKIVLLLTCSIFISALGSVKAQEAKPSNVNLNFTVSNARQLLVAKDNFNIIIAGDNAVFPDNTKLRWRLLRHYPVVYTNGPEFFNDSREYQEFDTKTSNFQHTIRVAAFAKNRPAPGYYKIKLMLSLRQRPIPRMHLGNAFHQNTDVEKLLWIGAKTSTLEMMKEEIVLAEKYNEELQSITNALMDIGVYYVGGGKEKEAEEAAERMRNGEAPLEIKARPGKRAELVALLQRVQVVRNESFDKFRNSVMTELFHLEYITTNQLMGMINALLEGGQSGQGPPADRPGARGGPRGRGGAKARQKDAEKEEGNEVEEKEPFDGRNYDFTLRMNKMHISFITHPGSFVFFR